MAHPETPLEERPPGRGRGSSVALLVGYLIGISHVDPLRWDLTLERFISQDMSTLPDIDLDFPRGLRDELIRRVHRHFGPEFAVLAGAVSAYSLKGVIQDLGKALGLPREDLNILSRQVQSRDGGGLREDGAGTTRLQGPGGGPGLAGPDRACPPVGGRPQGPGPARGGYGPQSIPHLRDGAHPGRGHGGALHHGLEQG